MKKVSLTGIFLSMFVVMGCATDEETESASEETYDITLGHLAETGHHYHEISERFAELVEERTDGNVNVEVYPSDQLGTQTESVEAVMSGAQDMVLTSDSVISGWVEDFGILNLPFLFEDMHQANEVLNSSPGAKLEEQLEEEHDTVLLGWWVNGFRHVTSSQEIQEPSDLQGMTIRTPESQVMMEVFENFGASPSPMGMGELYTALQQGTVDGQENPTTNIIDNSMYEVQDYIARTSHIYQTEPILINRTLLESMPEEYQEAIIETGKELEQEHIEMVETREEEEWDQIEEEGMTINDVDTEVFREASEPVYDTVRESLDEEILDDILEHTGQ